MASPRASANDLGTAWKGLSSRSKAILVALVAAISGWSTVKSAAIDPLWQRYTHRQPQYDAALISKLEPGMTLARFQSELSTQPVAVIPEDIHVRMGYPPTSTTVRDELFMLDSDYVEAFVSPTDQEVVAYAVTARGNGEPQTLRIGGTHVTLQKTRIAQFHLLGPEYVSGSCGAHLSAYYEISESSGATLDRTLAAGVTDTGALSPTTRPINCGPPNISHLPYATDADRVPVVDDHYAAGLQRPDETFLKSAYAYRSTREINAVAITAPDVQPFRELISLHPQVIDQFGQ